MEAEGLSKAAILSFKSCYVALVRRARAARAAPRRSAHARARASLTGSLTYLSRVRSRIASAQHR